MCLLFFFDSKIQNSQFSPNGTISSKNQTYPQRTHLHPWPPELIKLKRHDRFLCQSISLEWSRWDEIVILLVSQTDQIMTVGSARMFLLSEVGDMNLWSLLCPANQVLVWFQHRCAMAASKLLHHVPPWLDGLCNLSQPCTCPTSIMLEVAFFLLPPKSQQKEQSLFAKPQVVVASCFFGCVFLAARNRNQPMRGLLLVKLCNDRFAHKHNMQLWCGNPSLVDRWTTQSLLMDIMESD